MRKTLLPLIGVLFWSLPALAGATPTGTLVPDVWYVETTVMLNGSSLAGPMPSQSKICFAPEVDLSDLHCFKSDHANVLNWTNSNITFIPPKNTPPVGKIVLVHPYQQQKCQTLYGKQVCEPETLRNEYPVASYRAHPYISQVLDMETGKPADIIKVGGRYQITGYRFGDFGVGLYIGVRMIDRTDVEMWSYSTIVFTLSKPLNGEHGLRVNNGAGMGNIWEHGTEDDFYTSVKTRTRGVIETPDLKASLLAQSSSSASSQSSDPLPIGKRSGLVFTDVSSEHPYAVAIIWGMNGGILNGYPDGAFRPERPVTRAEFLKIILESNPEVDLTVPQEKSSFKDVDENEWYAPYVRYAEWAGIVEGYPDGTFHPGQEVNVAEGLKMLYSFLAIPTQQQEGQAWYERYLTHARNNAVLFSADIQPEHPMKRKDVIWSVWKLLAR